MAEHYFALQEDYDSQIQSLSPPDTIESIDIDNVESRLDQLFKLKQKYKLASVPELIQFANDLENGYPHKVTTKNNSNPFKINTMCKNILFTHLP